ncbi:MAG: translation initiation factor IF-2 [Candidatus Doudnabacteria bacterium]|nr:translation initiation factor IF-2 [Candidatus Doudnabacteria bacterium]
MNISSLSQQLNISVSELRRRIKEAGFNLSPTVRKIDNVLAKDILQRLTSKPASPPPAAVPPAKKQVTLSPVVSVRELSGLLGVPVTAVIKTLLTNGVMASLNEQIDFDAAAVVATEFGFEPTEDKKSDLFLNTSVTDVLAKENEQALQTRPPIVAVMGHVDHGKTKLLDTIRSANVSALEAGAITQHIGAYRALYKGTTITFLDTPGHEAFAAMRARGANVTDIIVLVVAADDGVKQQTLEVINRARLTRTPLIVAINKIDKPEANPELVKKQLAEAGVQPEEWGGKAPFVPISAKNNIGVDKLLDTVILTAEVENYRANPKGTTVATVIESHLSKTKGPVATVIVQNGTLNVGDCVVAGGAYGRVRIMEDENRKAVKTVSPSIPARISGLSAVPEVGDLLRVFPDAQQAQSEARQVLQHRSAKHFAIKTGIVADRENQRLNLIVKADTQGSLEAISQELQKLENEDVKIKIVSQGVGDINESDVLSAQSSQATLVGFHNSVLPSAARLARQKGVNIDVYDIIYELTEDITRAILNLILPEVEEVIVGKAKLLAIFRTEKNFVIAGGVVEEGKLQADKKLQVFRQGQKIGTGKLTELQRNKEQVRQVEAGVECGMKISSTVPLQKGDLVAIFQEKLKEKKLRRVQEK